MAIPFNLPSDDETLEQYRNIHQLLIDLTAILRALLARNPSWVRPNPHQHAAANNNHDNGNNLNTNNQSTNQVAPPHDCIHHNHSYGRMAGRAQNPAVPLGLPLSPPNSQPGSPSPFFNSATSFVLPDVVSNAARTLNDLAFPNLLPNSAVVSGSVGRTPATAAPIPSHHGRRPGTGVVRRREENEENKESVPLSQRLRKRKRDGRLMRKKYKPQALDLNNTNNDSGSNNGMPVAPRKIPRTAYDSPCSCFNVASTAEDSTDNASNLVAQMNREVQQQEQQAFFPEVPRLSNTTGPQECSSPDEIPLCLHFGEELRKIIECYRCPRKIISGTSSISSLESNTKSTNGRGHGHGDDDDLDDTSESGFFSQFGRTMFTAALLVIGWKLLKHD